MVSKTCNDWGSVSVAGVYGPGVVCCVGDTMKRRPCSRCGNYPGKEKYDILKIRKVRFHYCKSCYAWIHATIVFFNRVGV